MLSGSNDCVPWLRVCVLRNLRDDFPGATIKASSLDDYTDALLEALPQLELQVRTAG